MQTDIDISFAGVSELGAQLSHHPMSRRGRLGSVFLALICFAATPLLLSLTAERIDLVNNTDSPSFVSASPWFIYWPAALAAVLLLAGAGLLISMVRNWKTFAAVYEHGLVLRDPSGLHQFRWEAVDEVWEAVTKFYRNGMHTNTVYVYTVRLHDGQKLKFNNGFVEIQELGKSIQSHVSAALLPRYAQALNHGQRLAFGPFAIDRERVYASDKSLLWAEVDAIKTHEGSIAIKSIGADNKDLGPFSVANVPNVWVFYELVIRSAQATACHQ